MRCCGGKRSRRRRDKVVFPDDDGPEMPTRSGGGDIFIVSSCSYCVGAWALLTRCRSFHLVLSIDNLQLRQSMWGGVGSVRVHPKSRACDTLDIPYNPLLSQSRGSATAHRFNSSSSFGLQHGAFAVDAGVKTRAIPAQDHQSLRNIVQGAHAPIPASV